MTGRPELPIPTWSENGAFPAGTDPWSGTATKSQPSLAQRNAGHVPNTQQPAQFENAMKNNVGHWIDYLADIGFMNWGPRNTKDSGGGSVTLTYNSNSGAQTFWSDYHQAWIIVGQNTVGKFFVGDANVFDPFAIGAATKYNFGAAANNGNLVMCTADDGATIPYNLVNPALSGGTPSTLAAPAGTGRATNALKLASGTILIVGAQNSLADTVIWRSTNSGTSFTKIVAAAGSGSTNPMLVERAGTIVLVDRNVTSPRFMNSTDDGQTWANITAPSGFDNIQSMWYSAEEDRFIGMGTNDRLWVAGPNLVFTSTRFDTLLSLGSTDGQAIAVSGSGILLATDNGSNKRAFYLSWDLGQHWRKLGGRSPYGGAPRLSVNPYGQFFTSSVVDVAQTISCAGVGAAARAE